MQDAKRSIAVFLTLTFVFSFGLESLIVFDTTIWRTYPFAVILAVMWAPGVAALAASLRDDRGIRRLGWRLGPPGYVLLAYSGPLVCGIVTYGAVWVSGIVRFPNPDAILVTVERMGALLPAHAALGTTIAAAIAYQGTIGFCTNLVFALGEEIGWRGFLVPNLRHVTSYTNTALLSGAVCSVYHYPMILFGGYHRGGPWWQNLGCFTILVMSAGFALAWLRLRSRSIWPAVAAHAAHNAFIQGALDPLATEGPSTRLLLGEFGITLPLAFAFVGLWAWTRRKALPDVGPNATQLVAGPQDRSLVAPSSVGEGHADDQFRVAR
jgi:membrane protease YdiL (CAAX protease family)